MEREAAARCPECRRFFCRECVTEHAGRMTCAACLRGVATEDETRRHRLSMLLGAIPCLVSFMLLWFFFFLVGRGLLNVPSAFHEGTMWQVEMFDEQ
jgi:hypothetical protein